MTALILDGQSLKTTLETLSSQQVESLKQVAIYYRVVRLQRIVAWSALGLSFSVMVFIALALILPALISYPVNFIIIQIGLNALLIGMSLRALLSSRVNGFLTLAFVLFVCGCWNVVTMFYGQVDLFKLILGLLGLFQLGYAFQSYRHNQRLSEFEPASLNPEPQLKQQYDSIWKTIVTSNSNLDPEYVWLTLFPSQNWWKKILLGSKPVVTCLLLLPDQALMAYKARKWLEFIPKAKLVIEIGEGYKLTISDVKPIPRATTKNGSKSKTSVSIYARLNDEVFSGYIYEQGLQQYIDWKQLTDFEAMNTETFANERQIHKKIQKRISNAVLLYIFIAVILIIYVMQHLPQS